MNFLLRLIHDRHTLFPVGKMLSGSSHRRVRCGSLTALRSVRIGHRDLFRVVDVLDPQTFYSTKLLSSLGDPERSPWSIGIGFGVWGVLGSITLLHTGHFQTTERFTARWASSRRPSDAFPGVRCRVEQFFLPEYGDGVFFLKLFAESSTASCSYSCASYRTLFYSLTFYRSVGFFTVPSFRLRSVFL